MPNTGTGSPIGLPISAPGTRETRRVTLNDEIRRVVYCGGGLMFASLLMVLSLWWDMSNLGPVIGVVVGAICLACLARYVQSAYPPATSFTLFALLVSLVLWGLRGYGWLSSWWPTRMSLPPTGVLFSTLLSISVKGISLLMGWAFFTELVDPNGPTPPRHATVRDKAIYPWSRETYAGRQLPATLYPASPPPRTVRVELASNGGRTGNFFSGIPDTPEWRSFCAAVVSKPDSFTEAEAKRHKVRLDNMTTPQGDIVQQGMRTIRSRLISGGYARWKNPAAHERGVVILRKGLAVMRAMATSQP